MTHPNKAELTNFLAEFNRISSIIQLEICQKLLTNPKAVARLKEQLAGTENEMEEAMNAAAREFFNVLLLAQSNRVNMWCKLLAMHTNFTDDPLLHEVFEEVNQRVFDQES